MYPYVRDRDQIGNSHAAPGEGHAGIGRMGYNLYRATGLEISRAWLTG